MLNRNMFSQNTKYRKIVHFKFSQNELKNLKKILLNIFESNENKKFKSFQLLLKNLNKKNFYKLKKNNYILDKFEKIENIILKKLRKNKNLKNKIQGIQFPIVVRIVHPVLSKSIKLRYNTENLHCDPWAGEPHDIINSIIFIEAKENTPKVNIYNCGKKLIKLNKKLSSYYKKKSFWNSPKHLEFLKETKNIDKVKINHKNGNGYLFNAFTLHNTDRSGKNVRISLDFRLRTKNPYSNVKKSKWKQPTSGWHRYWLLPKKNTQTYNERLINEIKTLVSRKDNKGLKMRLSTQP